MSTKTLFQVTIKRSDLTRGVFNSYSVYFVSGKAHSNNEKETRKIQRNTQTHIKRRKHIHVLRIKA